MQTAFVCTLICAFLCSEAQKPPPAGSFEVSSGSYNLPNGFLCGRESACIIFHPTDLSQGPFPIASFGHGSGGQIARDLIQSIASLGFVVVAPDTPNCNDHGADILNAMEDSRLNPSLHPALARVDFSRRAVFGHSFGGAHAMGAAATAGDEHNLKAVIGSHGTSEGGAAQLTLPLMITSEVTPRGRRHRAAFNAAAQANPRMFAVAQGARHLEPLQGGRLNPFMAHFFGCHVAELQSSCDLIYGNSEDSLCRAQPMSACEVVGTFQVGDPVPAPVPAPAPAPPNDNQNPQPTPAPAPPAQTPDENENPTEITGFSKLGDGACRTYGNGFGTFTLAAAANLQECQTACATEEACLAIEFRVGRCELHTEAVLAVANQAGPVCFLKEDNGEVESPELNSAEQYVPHLILLTMLLSLHVL